MQHSIGSKVYSIETEFEDSLSINSADWNPGICFFRVNKLDEQ